MIILGIDPSLRATGLAVIELDGIIRRLRWHDVVFFDSAVGLRETFIAEQIHLRLAQWIDHVNLVGVEWPFTRARAMVSIRQGALYGAICMGFPVDLRSSIVQVFPTQTRKAVNAATKGPKDVVVAAVERKYSIDWGEKSKAYREAVCDAIGVGHAAHLLAGEQ